MDGPKEKVEERSGAHCFSPLVESIDLRAIRPSDIDQVMAIERASFSSPWSAQFFLEEIGVSYSKSLLAEFQGKVIGYLVFWQLPVEVDIHNLAVHPDHRRKGIGRFLLNTMIHTAKKRGFKRIILEVRKSNRPAQRLYQSLGFIQNGVRKGYYSNDGEDALLMVLELNK
jgi:[ribosomal protein S18]-alanine N-acetyltransferase